MAHAPRLPRRCSVGLVAALLASFLVGTVAMPVPVPTAGAMRPTAPTETVYEGTGTQVLAIELPDPAEVAVATVTHSGESNFAIWELDEDLSQVALAVNTIGDYTGTVPLNLTADVTTTSLEITADGSWRIEVRPILDIRFFDTEVAGTGDDVVAYLGETQVVSLAHEGDSNFAVWSHGEESELVVNEIGAYNATVPLPGPAILVITANGPWSIHPT